MGSEGEEGGGEEGEGEGRREREREKGEGEGLTVLQSAKRRGQRQQPQESNGHTPSRGTPPDSQVVRALPRGCPLLECRNPPLAAPRPLRPPSLHSKEDAAVPRLEGPPETRPHLCALPRAIFPGWSLCARDAAQSSYGAPTYAGGSAPLPTPLEE